MVDWTKPLRYNRSKLPVRFLGRRKHADFPVILLQDLGQKEQVMCCSEEGQSSYGGQVENPPEMVSLYGNLYVGKNKDVALFCGSRLPPIPDSCVGQFVVEYEDGKPETATIKFIPEGSK